MPPPFGTLPNHHSLQASSVTDLMRSLGYGTEQRRDPNIDVIFWNVGGIGEDSYSDKSNIDESIKRKDQQDATIRCLLLTSVSTCFEHHYAHLQEIKGPVTAFGVLFWFCWM